MGPEGFTKYEIKIDALTEAHQQIKTIGGTEIIKVIVSLPNHNMIASTASVFFIMENIVKYFKPWRAKK